MVNPGSFRGTRLAFLNAEKPAYAAAVAGGYVADALALIQRRYFKRFPIDLPHEEDPTEEFLAGVDDDAPDAEVEAPCTSLDSEEYERSLKAVQARRISIVYRKAQIKRWMAYQHMKDSDIDPKESGAQNPYTVLLHKLAGISTIKPRFKPAVNVWGKCHAAQIEIELKRRLAGMDGAAARRQQVGVRGQVTRELFKALPLVDQQQWETQAQQEHAANLAKWKADMEGEPSTAPADRQRCIQGLVRFAQPILDIIVAATGFKATLIAGGPEPADGGRLNIISVHSGTTPGSVKANFGRAERRRYRQQIVPIFGQFLKICYTPEECRSRALPIQEGFESLQTQGIECDGATFDAVDPTPAQGTSKNLSIESGPGPQPSNDAESHQPASSEHTPAIVEATPIRATSRARSRAVSRSVSRSISQILSPAPYSNPASLNPSPVQSRPLLPDQSPAHSRQPSPSLALAHDTHPSTVSRKSTRTTRASKGSGRTVANPNTSRESPLESDNTVPSRKRPRRPSDVLPRPAKRVRGSKPCTDAIIDASPALISIPANAPVWFCNANTLFSDDSLGSRWHQLTLAWMSFEIQRDFKEDGRLIAVGRPQAVSDWIRRARPITWRPVIDNLKRYEKIHMTWWESIQAAGEHDREKLRVSGTNGIVSVLASLFYWGSVARKSGKTCKRWDAAVEECLKVVT